MTEPPQFPPPPDDGEPTRPYPQQPGQQPPPYPTPYYGPGGYPPPPKEGKGGKIGLGIALGIAAPFVLGFLGAALSSLTGGGVGSAELGLSFPLLLLIPIGLLIPEKTRYIGVGMFIAYAGMLVIGAGLCVVLIAGMSGMG